MTGKLERCRYGARISLWMRRAKVEDWRSAGEWDLWVGYSSMENGCR